LDIAERLLVRAPNVSVLVVDRFMSESFRSEILESVERRALTNVRLLPNVTPTRIMEHLNRATIGIIPALNLPKNFKALPTKLFEYMAAGIPVAASGHPHTAAVLEDAACGVCCDPDSPESFVEAILRLTADPNAARAMGAAGQSAFLDRYTWKSQHTALTSYYERIVGSRGQGRVEERAARVRKAESAMARTSIYRRWQRDPHLLYVRAALSMGALRERRSRSDHIDLFLAPPDRCDRRHVGHSALIASSDATSGSVSTFS